MLEDLAITQKQLEDYQTRLDRLEQQVKKIAEDLPPQVSRTILQMKQDVKILQEKSDAQPDYEAPYVYSEKIEMLGDVYRKLEWRITDTVKNKLGDIELQMQMIEIPDDQTLETSRKISGDLSGIKSQVLENYEKDKEDIEKLEQEASELTILLKSASNDTSSVTSHTIAEVDSQQIQINELERVVNRLPEFINNNRRLNEKFSNLHQTNHDSSEILDTERKRINIAKAYEIEDITEPLNLLDANFQSIMSVYKNDIDDILRRVDSLSKNTDENEQKILKIAETQGKVTEQLAEIEDQTLDLMDKADDLETSLSANSNKEPVDKIGNEARTSLREIRKEMAIIKSAITKRESLNFQNNRTNT